MRKDATTSMAWISESDYETLRALMIDGHILPATYQEWKRHVQRSMEMLAAKGHVVVKVNVDPDRFAIWCREWAIPISSASCRQYAMAVMALRATREQD